MFLLVTGASGAGKSTARRSVAQLLTREIACVEFHDVMSAPTFPDIAWRQRATEALCSVRWSCKPPGHLLLSGDPVAAGEVLAASSAVDLDGIAVCWLDLSPDAQTDRLARRGDDAALLPHHHAFADWTRGHARDPRLMPHVLSTDGWVAMRWERLTGIDRSDGRVADSGPALDGQVSRSRPGFPRVGRRSPGLVPGPILVRAPVRGRWQADERFGDGPGSDQLCAHLRHVAHVALPAPLHKLRDKLVELRRAQISGRDRPDSISRSWPTFAALSPAVNRSVP